MQNKEGQTTLKKTRREDIDILKGIGIILVLIGHSFQHGLHFNIIYSFHMPLFFIVAGYFFKKKPVIDLLKKDFARLLVPYYFIIILTILLSVVYDYIGIETIQTAEAIKMLYNHDVGAIWFLAALFWARQLFNLLLYITNNKWVLFLIGLSLMVGILCIKTYFDGLPYYSFVFQGITGVVFVFIGYVAKGFDLINIIKPIWRKLLLGFISVAWILSCLGEPMNMMRFEYHNFIIFDILFASVGTYLCYLISYYISIKSKYLSRFLVFMGIYSIVILCWGPIKYHFISYKTIPLVANLFVKVVWLIFSLYMTIKIPFLRKIFQLQK
jgi:fucose 4-O-acetylase-like acetyltransferase